MQLEHAWNPIALTNDVVAIEITDGLSPNQVIARNALAFSRPVMCMVNGQFWSRRDWDFPVPKGGFIRFVELPRGGGDSNPLRIIATIALIAAAAFVPGMMGFLPGTLMGGVISAGIMIGGTLLLNMFFGSGVSGDSGGGSYGTAKTIYSVNGSSNRLRIGEPFAEHFGRMLRFPDLAQASYTRIEDNEQYLYFLGFIGIGSFTIESVNIDKTPMGDYAEATYNILEPGHIPEIVTNVVWTSAEISGQEISTDYLTAIASGSGTSAYHLEYDVQFGQLIGFNDDGSQRPVSVTILAECRLVDYRGIATSEWVTLNSRTYSAASKDTLRFSNKIAAPLGPGRYEFRVKRTTAPSEDSKISDKCSIIGLRAYGGKHPQYGNVTMIECKIKATDQLNGDVANRINVVATRLLYPVTDTGFAQSPEPSRSIVDAIAYITTSENGGMQDDIFLLFDVMSGIKVKLDNQLGHQFDWVFTGRTTVMDACVKAAQCGRAVPYLPGGQLAIVRDDYQELPKMVFTDDDFDADSLAITSTYPTVDAFTCVKVSYIDGDTWQDEQVVYYDERGSELIPYELTLEGCTNRQQAWEMASYLYRDMFANTINVEFTTGLKGHLPSLFDKIAIGATNVDWGQSGKIAAVETGLIWLTEPIDFKGETEGKLLITTSDGTADGPHTVLPVAGNPYCVAGTITGLLTLKDDDLAATSYLFGPASVDPLYIRLMGIQPQGRNKVRLFGTVVTDSVYDSPGAVIPPGLNIPASDPLVSVSLEYRGLSGSDHQFSAVWAGSAVKYKVELSTGGAYSTMNDNYTQYQKLFTTSSSVVTVRVTPYSVDTLLTDSAMTATYTVIAAPTGLTLVNADADSVDVSWTAVTGATAYDVAVFVDGAKEGSRMVMTTSASILTSELTGLGGPWPAFDVKVSAIKGAEIGAPATLSVSIPAMSAPTGLTLQQVLSGGVMLSWGSVAGASGYKVYVGTTAGFDPETEGTLAYSGSSVSAVCVVSVTSPYNHYFKVAGTNGYYQDAADLVFSSALNVTG